MTVADEELVAAVHGAFGASCVRRIDRRPSRYATSHGIEEVDVHLLERGLVPLVLKDPCDDALLPAARSARPSFLRDPEREAAVYRRLLVDDGPPRLVASGPRGNPWLLLERVPGVELYQVGEVALWAAAARWLARFHAHHVVTAGDALLEPILLVHDRRYHARWYERAAGRPDLEPLLGAYENAARVLEAVPRTVVHGEFHASNVLVCRSRPVRVAPIDWESAAIASAPVDLADLVTGWDAETTATLLDAYWSEAGPELGIRDVDHLRRLVAHARIVAAVRLLTWAPAWSPPPEHARDWAVEAKDAMLELNG